MPSGLATSSGACASASSPCLFDVVGDPLEKTNLAIDTSNSTIAQLLHAMQERLDYHRKRTYSLDIDHTNYTAAQYCDIIKQQRWVQPFGYAPAVAMVSDGFALTV